jgi:hypothetical protein
MRTGTKSVLWGAHCFFIHPWFVALAWWKLYGAPRDPRLWVAFFVHDLGYWGKRNMDDAEGERHVEWGALVMLRLFGPAWHDLCLFHSRYYAKRYGRPYSRLCVADKLAITLEPWWLYLPRVIASGEIREYLAYARGQVETAHGDAAESDYARQSATIRGWHRAMITYCRAWVAEHKNGKEDTWTPATPKQTQDDLLKAFRKALEPPE